MAWVIAQRMTGTPNRLMAWLRCVAAPAVCGLRTRLMVNSPKVEVFTSAEAA